MKAPLVIDLYCGLGGWAEGFLAEGYTVIGFDIERHDYGTGGYLGVLVIQDVLTLHGSQFKEANVIVASPPCQAYSYRAMPWSRARALPPPDNTLFEAPFRVQREAIEAAGHHIPLIVENVCGAQKWVGRAKWHFGSYYLWGDVPALMPTTLGRKNNGGSWFNLAHNTESGHGKNPVNFPEQHLGQKIEGQDWNNFRCSGEVSPHWRMQGIKTLAHLNRRDGESHTRHLTNQREHIRIEEAGVKLLSPGHYRKPGSGADWFDGGTAAFGSKTSRRAAAAAAIAKIPFPLAQHIARCFR